MRSFTNQTYDEIPVGASLTLSHVLTEADVEALAMVSGEIDPFHIDSEAPPQEMVSDAVGAEALVSGMLNRRLPGPGTNILEAARDVLGLIRAGRAAK